MISDLCFWFTHEYATVLSVSLPSVSLKSWANCSNCTFCFSVYPRKGASDPFLSVVCLRDLNDQTKNFVTVLNNGFLLGCGPNYGVTSNLDGLCFSVMCSSAKRETRSFSPKYVADTKDFTSGPFWDSCAYGLRY